MSTLSLYSIVIFAWSTSWFAIKFQLDVPDTVSVGYRFLLSGVLLTAFVLAKGKKLSFSLKDHAWIFLLSLFLFCLNYVTTYEASRYLVSGVVAVVFSTFVFMNMFNARIFHKQPVQKETLFAAVLGFIGIGMVFKNEIAQIGNAKNVVFGIGVGLLSTYIASLGNMVQIKVRARQIPVVESTALAMLYGGLVTLLFAASTGEKLSLPAAPSFWGSLIYLSVVASILAFLSYFELLRRIGPARAGYSTLVFPIFALTISIFFEGYRLTLSNVLGILFILFGNYIILWPKKAEALLKRFPLPRAHRQL